MDVRSGRKKGQMVVPLFPSQETMVRQYRQVLIPGSEDKGRLEQDPDTYDSDRVPTHLLNGYFYNGRLDRNRSV